MNKKYFLIDQDLELKAKENFLILKNSKNKIKEKFGLAKYLNIGYYLIIPILFGIFFGLFLDNRLKTKKTFLIMFFLIGIFASFYNLYKIYIDERRKNH
ncbi:MAG: AtpZ/AtpI family protein [Candidatus Roizmanbacteria bacterium]|nr:AtpZ/AtpI family protein [Candidatus Roizmanbacteria bacterium]